MNEVHAISKIFIENGYEGRILTNLFQYIYFKTARSILTTPNVATMVNCRSEHGHK